MKTITLEISDKLYETLERASERLQVSKEDFLLNPLYSYSELENKGIDLFKFVQQLGK